MPSVAAQRRGLLSTCLGNLVEFYDFAVFGGSAAVLALVLTTGQGELTSIFVVLAAALCSSGGSRTGGAGALRSW